MPSEPGGRVLTRDGFIADDAAQQRVRLAPNEDARALALDGVTLVELVLPKMSEGRPYTQARILREERGYTGAIRAVGEVRRDLLFFLFRCGVDQAVLKDPDEERDAHQALATFSVLYQGAADVKAPLWKRAARGVAQ
jgi:uncharacterized protein (DUF934 family)